MPSIPYIIFRNSFQAALIVPIHSEYAWFAAHGFGYEMLNVTCISVVGATLAMAINFFMGYWLAYRRISRFNLTEENYQKIAKYFRRYVFLLLLFPSLPFLGLVTVACGFFRTRPLFALAAIALGRIGYYSFYLIKYSYGSVYG